jgi:cell wall assembly regulator SMI1
MKINLHKNQGSISGGVEVKGHWLLFYLENDESETGMSLEEDSQGTVGQIIRKKDTKSQSIRAIGNDYLFDYLAEKDES